MTIQEKLLFVQQNLKAPKSQYNSFGDYHYRNCEDILEALKPLLAEIKAVILIHDDILLIGDKFYVKATAVLQDAESQDSISNTAFARETEQRPKMDMAQITGACSSYARKYALNGLFCIDDSKDPDSMKNDDSKGDNRQQNKPQQNKPNNVTQAHINTIRAEIKRTGAMEKAVCYQYKIKRLEDMTMEQFKNAMTIFKQMETKQPENYQMTLDGMEQYNGEMPFA